MGRRPRSGKRLESWIAAIGATAKELEQAESDQLTLDEAAKELEQAQLALDKLRRDLKGFEARYGTLAEIQAALEQRRGQIKLAEAERVERTAMEAAARVNIDTDLAKMCDRDAVLKAAETMRRIQHSRPSSANRERFSEAQDAVRREAKRLADSGFAWAFADALIDINYNPAVFMLGRVDAVSDGVR
jgi:DNA repair exonuclease SbcCD ATPase subunit